MGLIVRSIVRAANPGSIANLYRDGSHQRRQPPAGDSLSYSFRPDPRRARTTGGAAAAGPTTPLADAIAALQKAYDDKAPAADVKAAIAKVENERKANAAAMTKAQDDLRSLLNARQEAYLILNGGILQ